MRTIEYVRTCTHFDAHRCDVLGSRVPLMRASLHKFIKLPLWQRTAIRWQRLGERLTERKFSPGMNTHQDLAVAEMAAENVAQIVPALNAKGAAMRRRRPPAVIAIASGERQAGRTTVTANLAVALGDRGCEVLVVDADFARASVDTLLGLDHDGDISDLLAAERTVDEILVQGPPGVHLLPGRAGAHEYATIGVREQAALIWALDALRRPVDLVLIDTAAGSGAEVATLVHAAHYVVVIVSDEPASSDSALRFITRLSRRRAVDRFKVLTNRALTQFAGRERFRELRRACDQLSDVTLEYVGSVPHDYSVKRAAQSRQSVFAADPRSRAARAYRSIAAQVESWARPKGLRGHLEFFAERLVEADGY